MSQPLTWPTIPVCLGSEMSFLDMSIRVLKPRKFLANKWFSINLQGTKYTPDPAGITRSVSILGMGRRQGDAGSWPPASQENWSNWSLNPLPSPSKISSLCKGHEGGFWGDGNALDHDFGAGYYCFHLSNSAKSKTSELYHFINYTSERWQRRTRSNSNSKPLDADFWVEQTATCPHTYWIPTHWSSQEHSLFKKMSHNKDTVERIFGSRGSFDSHQLSGIN